MDSRHVFILAGEPSGDRHAAALATELLRLRPDLSLSGIGGDGMRDAGVRLLYHCDRLAFMGFAEVVRHLPFLRRVMHEVLAFIRTTRPGVVVLVDYPAFNLRVARRAKAMGCRVLYYIAPQVWAWHSERVIDLAAWTDRIACVLPFEEAFFRTRGKALGVDPPALFVGHPLRDSARPLVDGEALREELLLPPGAPLLAVLPGSRRQEATRLLGPMARAVDLLRRRRPELIPLLCAAPGLSDALLHRLLARTPLTPASPLPAGTRYRADEGIHLIRGRTADVLSAARGALVASGTATLEAGLLDTPMVIAYRLHPLSWHISRHKVKVPHIGLVNLVAGERIVPELLQQQATPERMAEELAPLLADGSRRRQMLAGLERMRQRLGPPGAARRTARLILDWIPPAEASV